MTNYEPKYAICNELFADWEHARTCEFVASLGYRGLEIAPFTFRTDAAKIDMATRRAFRRTAELAGLQIVGLHWLLAETDGLYLTSPDLATRKRTAEFVSALIGLCGDLGGQILVWGSPQQRNVLPGVTQSQAMGYAADTISRCIPALERHGAKIALEPLGPEEGNFLNTAAEARELIRTISSQHVGLHLDVKAMSSESIPITELIRTYASDMIHLHANDPNRQGPGMGEVDFVPIMSSLRDAAYDGWVSVEAFDASPGIERLARESIHCLQSAWNA